MCRVVTAATSNHRPRDISSNGCSIEGGVVREEDAEEEDGATAGYFSGPSAAAVAVPTVVAAVQRHAEAPVGFKETHGT